MKLIIKEHGLGRLKNDIEASYMCSFIPRKIIEVCIHLIQTYHTCMSLSCTLVEKHDELLASTLEPGSFMNHDALFLSLLMSLMWEVLKIK